MRNKRKLKFCVDFSTELSKLKHPHLPKLKVSDTIATGKNYLKT